MYNDPVVRCRETIGGFNRPPNLVLEEANKLFNGAAATEGSSEGGQARVGGAVEIWRTMFRDGLKYLIYLHPVVQTVTDLPSGLDSSCNNAFLCQMKSPTDRELAMCQIAGSQRGFTDEEYKRFLSRMPAQMAIVKPGYSEELAQLEPMLVRPARVPGLEPGDAEILAHFGPI